MVIFNLLSKNENEIKYEYYPEGNKEYEPGTIVIDLVKMCVKEMFPSKLDCCLKHTVAEINELRNSVNKMRIEEGEPELTEEEWPSAKEDVEYFKYAQHAIDKIDEMYEADGEFPSEGTVAWY